MKQVINGSTLRTPTLRARRRAPSAAPPAPPRHAGPAPRPSTCRTRRSGTGLMLLVRAADVGPGSARLPTRRPPGRPAPALGRGRRRPVRRKPRPPPGRPTGPHSSGRQAGGGPAPGRIAIRRSRRTRTARGSRGREGRRTAQRAPARSATPRSRGRLERDAARHAPPAALLRASAARSRPGRRSGRQADSGRGPARSPARRPDDAWRTGDDWLVAVRAREPPGRETGARPGRRREPIQPGQQRVHASPPSIRGHATTPLVGPGPRSTARRGRPGPRRPADSPSPAARPEPADGFAAEQVAEPDAATGKNAMTLPVAAAPRARRRPQPADPARLRALRQPDPTTPTSVRRSGWRPARPERARAGPHGQAGVPGRARPGPRHHPGPAHHGTPQHRVVPAAPARATLVTGRSQLGGQRRAGPSHLVLPAPDEPGPAVVVQQPGQGPAEDEEGQAEDRTTAPSSTTATRTTTTIRARPGQAGGNPDRDPASALAWSTRQGTSAPQGRSAPRRPRARPDPRAAAATHPTTRPGRRTAGTAVPSSVEQPFQLRPARTAFHPTVGGEQHGPFGVHQNRGGRPTNTEISLTRRTPASSRLTCTTACSADVSWACNACRSSPPKAAKASRRAGTSAAELACTVPHPPSCRCSARSAGRRSPGPGPRRRRGGPAASAATAGPGRSA